MIHDATISVENQKETLHISYDPETQEGKDYEFPPGGIVWDLIGIDFSFIRMMQNELSEILKKWDNEKIGDVAEQLRRIANLFGEKDWLSELFLTMPLLPFYHSEDRELGRNLSLLSNETRSLEYLKQEEGEDTEEFSEGVQERYLTLTESELILYDEWTTLLYGLDDDPALTKEDYIKYLTRDNQIVPNCMVIARLHVERAKDFLIEIEQIKSELLNAYDDLAQDNFFPEYIWMRSALNDIYPYVEHRASAVRGEDNNHPLKINLSSKPNNKKWICNSLSGLVAAEICALGNQAHIPRKCALCGKPFIPYSQKNIFCKNPNPKYENKPCNEVGPVLKREMKLENDKVTHQYENNYRAYSKWIQKQIDILEKYLKQQESELNKSDYDVLESEIKNIKWDIKKNFREWVNQCRITTEEWKENMMDTDGETNDAMLSEEKRVLDLIKLKPVKLRSEKYAQWKADQRQMLGLE